MSINDKSIFFLILLNKYSKIFYVHISNLLNILCCFSSGNDGYNLKWKLQYNKYACAIFFCQFKNMDTPHKSKILKLKIQKIILYLHTIIYKVIVLKKMVLNANCKVFLFTIPNNQQIQRHTDLSIASNLLSLQAKIRQKEQIIIVYGG